MRTSDIEELDSYWSHNDNSVKIVDTIPDGWKQLKDQDFYNISKYKDVEIIYVKSERKYGAISTKSNEHLLV